jgi:outer membrane protein
MKKIFIALSTITLLFLMSSSMALGFKIGVIDLQKILRTSPQFKTADSAFKKEFKPREEKIKAEIATLQDMVKKFNRDSSVMSEKQKQKKQHAIISTRNKIQKEQSQLAQDAQTEQTKLMKNILTKVRSSVNIIAKQGDYDLIVQKSTTVYYKNHYDITDEVISALK